MDTTESQWDPETEWEVEKIIGKQRLDDGTVEYRVLWKGWPVETATWEPLENLTCCDEKIQEFEKKGNARRSKRISSQNGRKNPDGEERK